MPDSRSFRLHAQAPLADAPLGVETVHVPSPGPGQVLLRVEACGACRTDLHIVEGDIPAHRMPVTLGHQVVGRIVEAGPPAPRPENPAEPATLPAVGDRVGAGWLAWADGTCDACRRGFENLCPSARFTGYDTDGGYAEFMLADAAFVYPLPAELGDPVAIAPLLCGGVVGFRALRLAGVPDGVPGRLLLVGFGNSASIALQAAIALGWECHVSTRSDLHRTVALELGAASAGAEVAPESMDAAVIFAPAGSLVPIALRAVRRGGIVTCAGITMSDIPSFPYSLLYGERQLRSVANATRQDARDLLAIAARSRIRTDVELFDLDGTRIALERVAEASLRASAVVRIDAQGASTR